MQSVGHKLRELLKSDDIVVAPGVYDGYSARLVEAAGFKTMATSGAAVSNSRLGIDDIGVMDLTENVAHCRHIVSSVSIPVTADADTGYGNPVNVHYTVRQFEQAGLAGINIEDQVHPKRCGHMPGKEVVSLSEMVKKVEAACIGRRDDGFMIIARTDALAIEGIEGTIKRVWAYVQAGADMIFPDAARSEDDIKRIVEAAGDIPVTINMGFGIRSRPTTPLVPVPILKKIGVRRISLPRMLPAAAIRGMQSALEAMKVSIETGVPQDRPDLVVGIEDIMTLMGYDEMRALEKRLLSMDAIEAKYGK